MNSIAGLKSYPLDVGEDAIAIPNPMVELDVHVQHQEQDEWCWAAVSSTVSKFFDANSSWSQCAIASHAFPDGNCCENGASGTCDQVWDLDKALGSTRNLKKYVEDQQVPVADLIDQLKQSAPVGIRIQWSNGKAHFVIIRGATQEGSGFGRVAISDPIYYDSVHTVEDLDGNYLNGNGVWTDTYYTKG